MKLNLCCGDDYREGYINIDFSDKRSDGKSIKVDLLNNVLLGLPYEDGSVQEVVFRESLEHFNRWNGQKVLKEINRVLKKGGIVDISVPNAFRQMYKFLERANEELSPEDFETAHERWNYWKWHDDLMGGTRETDGFDGDSHKTLYSPSALVSCLNKAGLKVINLRVEDSIFVKAIKS